VAVSPAERPSVPVSPPPAPEAPVAVSPAERPSAPSSPPLPPPAPLAPSSFGSTPLELPPLPISRPRGVTPPATGGAVERALAIDLPSFDDVETGPPLVHGGSLGTPPDRLAVPLSEAAAAPLVLEMSDEDFGEDLDKAPTLALEDDFEAPATADAPAAALELEEPDDSDLATTHELPGPPPAPPAPPAPIGGAVSVRGADDSDLVTTHELPGPPPAPPPPSDADASITQGLEEIEFFRQQGLEDDARMLLEGLAADHPGDARIVAKLAELSGSAAAAAPAAAPAAPPSDALAALESAFDAMESGASGAHALPDQPQEPVSELAPADATMHFDLGIAYREMGVLDRAVEEFQLAAKDPLREASCQAMIGACLLGLGKTREAIEEYKRGLHARRRSETDELELYYGLADVHLSMGEGNEALFYLQTIKRRNPEFRDVARKLSTLQSATRPGKRPGPRAEASTADGPEDEGRIDEAFDDFFKEGQS
jgi:hypothetical protein